MSNKHNKPRRPRNLVAQAAKFRKAGVHTKSRSTKRRQHKQELANAVLDFLSSDAPINSRSGGIFLKHSPFCHLFCRIVA
ncbi:MAG: hypothetical protein KAH22_06145 [Thiotrichaceae bacterium]|nr:hypothetical protein [Thiotrichaceae bacterium]